MLSNEYELYVAENIKLARSLCIKSQQSIEAINQFLFSVGIDTADLHPSSYKYYVNLRGLVWTTAEYMPAYSNIKVVDDDVMYFTSLDTGVVGVELTPANLALHPATHSELRRFDKYYKNLVTVYPHQEYLIRRIIDPIYTDIQIMFTGDSMLPVAFNSANLLLNPLAAYDLKQDASVLLAAYPDYTGYINAVLSEIYFDGFTIQTKLTGDLDYDSYSLIEAMDGTILFHDTRLVEENELTLISKLQKWIYNYIHRWQLIAFNNSDNLYPASSHGILTLATVNVLLDLRLDRIKTIEAHSFHIWQYLGGYYKLDQFRDSLNTRQALWLYRNIEYITQTAGTKATLLFIYDNLIKRHPGELHGMTLNAFEIRQDSSGLAENLVNAIVVNKYPIDSKNVIDKKVNRYSVSDFMEMIKRQGIINEINLIPDTENLIRLAQRTTSTNIATGVIECQKEFNSIDSMFNVYEERFNNWFYLASLGVDRLKVTTKLSLIGREDFPLNATDAILVMLYCADRYAKYNAHYNATTLEPLPFAENIPNIVAQDLIHVGAGGNMTLIEEMLYDDRLLDGAIPTVDHPYIHNPYYSNGLETIIETELVDMIRDYGNFNTIEEFQAYTDLIVKLKVTTRLAIASGIDTNHRSVLENAFAKAFRDRVCTFTSDTTWKAFTDSLEVDITDLTHEEYGNIILTIVKAYIGDMTVTEGLASPYYELMQILRILSSYTVTFIPGDSSGISYPLNWSPMDAKLESVASFYKFPVELVCYEVPLEFTITP